MDIMVIDPFLALFLALALVEGVAEGEVRVQAKDRRWMLMRSRECSLPETRGLHRRLPRQPLRRSLWRCPLVQVPAMRDWG